MRVIINADDFGLNSTVNLAIEDCIQHGLITSTTIMAAGAGFDEAIEIANNNPCISYGVHLTLDELSSLTKLPIFHKCGLTDDQGTFIKGGVFRVKEWSDELLMAVQQELETQIDKVMSVGITPSHFDGHHHCHTLQALHRVILNISQKYNIKKIRVPLNSRTLHMIIHHVTAATHKHSLPVSMSDLSNREESLIKRVLKNFSMIQNDFYFKHYFETADHCCSVSSFKKNEAYMIRNMAKKTIELMCHPGHPNYKEETDLLKTLPFDLVRISYFSL